MSIQQAVQQHYLTHWGRPTRVFTVRMDHIFVEVWKWSAQATDQGVVLYATSGPHSNGGMSHKREFVIGLNEDHDEIAKIFGLLWVDGTREDAGHGISVDVSGPLWPGTEMTQLLLVRQRAVIPPLPIDAEVHVEFLRVIPLYAREAEFKNRFDEMELLRRWRDMGVNYVDPNRSEAVPQS